MSQEYIPMKTSECRPFIVKGLNIKTQGAVFTVTEVDERFFTAEQETDGGHSTIVFDFKNDKAEIGLPLNVVLDEFKACRQLLFIKEACLKSAEHECDELRDALKAAESILWMAEKYAEGGGSSGIEMQDYREVIAKVESALLEPADSVAGHTLP